MPFPHFVSSWHIIVIARLARGGDKLYSPFVQTLACVQHNHYHTNNHHTTIQQEEAQAQWASGQPFSLNVRAPWADKEVAMPELTEEQKAYIAAQVCC